MIKYKIESDFLDQFDNNSSFAITKAISKIGEINLRHGDRSTSFKVPLTAKNTKLLNYVTIINSSTSNKSFQRIQGKLVEDDVVISDGYFQVTKFNPYKKEVDMRFYGGNTDWFTDLKDKKINQTYTGTNSYNVNDIINVVISPQSIINSFATELSNNNPYKFFLIDNNLDTERNTSNDIILDTDITDYQLGVSQGVIFDRIMSSINVNTKGDMFNDPKYYNTLVSSSKNLGTIAVVNESESYGEANMLESPKQFLSTNVFSTLDYLDEEFIVGEWDGRTITLLGDSDKIELEFTVNFFGPDNSSFTGNAELIFKVVKNLGKSTQADLIGNTIEPLTEVIVTGSSSGVVGTSAYHCKIGGILITSSLLSSDTVTVLYQTNIPTNIQDIEYYAADLSYINGVPQPVFTFNLSNYVTPTSGNDLIPNISQSEFIKDTLVQFGAISQYDVKTKTLTCNKFDIIDSNKRNAIDWSSRVDLNVLPNVDLTKVVSKYGKRSFFKYSENDDSDVLNTLYKAITNYRLGDGIIEIDNGFLSDDKDIYESPYSPTITTATFPFSNDDPDLRGNFFLPFVPLYTKTSATENEDNDLNPRKFLYVGDVNILNAYKGNTEIVRIGGSSANQVLSLPLVYFDKNNYPYGFDSVINDFKDSLSFGRLSDLSTSDNNSALLEETNTVTNVNGDQNNTIIKDYYSFQNKVLNKPIYLEINLMLTSLDVQNVDFFTPIFLNFGLDSGYYYIDEISQYKGQDKSTKVKLVKI